MQLHGGHPTKPSLYYTTIHPDYSFNHVCVVVSAMLRESSRLDIYPDPCMGSFTSPGTDTNQKGPTDFSVSSGRDRQCGVNEIAHVLKQQQEDLNPSPLDWQSGALTTESLSMGRTLVSLWLTSRTVNLRTFQWSSTKKTVSEFQGSRMRWLCLPNDLTCWYEYWFSVSVATSTAGKTISNTYYYITHSQDSRNTDTQTLSFYGGYQCHHGCNVVS